MPAGGLLASLLAIVLAGVTDWRGLFLIGALPLVILFPLALPETAGVPALAPRPRPHRRGPRPSMKTGIPLEDSDPAAARLPMLPGDFRHSPAAVSKDGRPLAGFAALASGNYRTPTILLGLMSFCGLLLTYGLNTWLPEIMGQHGYGKTYSLTFLLALNAGPWWAGSSPHGSRTGSVPKAVVSTTFVIAAVALVLLTLELPARLCC